MVILTRSLLKTGQIRVRQFVIVNMHGAKLCAARQGWNVLAGVEQSLRVKRRFQGMKNANLIRLELAAHLVDLFAPNTVLTCDRAACRDTKLKNLATHLFGKRQLALFIGIKQDQRVHVAVASVEYIGNCQAALLGKCGNAFEYAGEFAAWNSAVHAVIVG